MSKELESLRLNIQNRLIDYKKSSFDFIQGKLDLSLSLSDQDFREIQKEANGYDITHEELIDLIKKVKSSIKLEPRIETTRSINLTEIKRGQHIKVITRDSKGEITEELIFLGKKQFVLIKHDRDSLMSGDILHSHSVSWTVGGFIEFNVFRNNEKLIREEEYSIYRTKEILYIQFLFPQFDYEAVFKST